MNDTILTIDIGTTSVKVSLFSTKLIQLTCYAEEYQLYTQDCYVEVNPSIYKEAILAALAKCFTQLPNLNVVAISVTTQGETLIPINQFGVPLHPAIVWLDSRAYKQAANFNNLYCSDTFYGITGLPEINAALPLTKLMWFAEEHPDIFHDTYKFLLLEDYILYWFTGRIVSEKTLLTSTGYFDIINDTYWYDGLAAANIPLEKLPEAIESGVFVGSLTEEAASELNLSPGIAVISGAMDQIAATLVTGSTNSGIITETTGTALVMAASTTSPTYSNNHHVTVYRHAIPGHYVYLPIGNTAGMALKWFRDEFCKDLISSNQDSYDLLNQLAIEVSPGCDGLLFLPYLSGCVDPDNNPDAKGVFFGAQLSTTRGHFIRSIMESIGYQLNDFLLMCEKLGCTPSTIYSFGGGSRSDLWQQIKADATGYTFNILPFSEASSYGAALLAAWGCNLIEPGTYPELTIVKSYKPNHDTHSIYKRHYERYNMLYQTLKPLF